MKRAACVFAWIGVCVTVVTVTPVTEWYARMLGGGFAPPSGGILVVLAASNIEDGIAGPTSYWRSVYAARAQRQAPFTSVIVTGGPAGASSAATPMVRLMAGAGIPEERIRREEASLSTRDSAVNLAALLRNAQEKVVLLTSDYHMLRARRAFRKAGLSVVPYPVPDGVKRASSWPGRWAVCTELAVESAKILYYGARGWI